MKHCFILICVIITYIIYVIFTTMYEQSVNFIKYNTVIQTTADDMTIPDKVRQNWEQFAPNIKREIFNDTQCIDFLRKEYNEDYVEQFNYLKNGAHKADLFRYAWLYKKGGVYMDIKTQLIKPFDELFPNSKLCYIVVTENGQPRGGRNGAERIYNGIIATPPNNPMIREMLGGVMKQNNNSEYLVNVTNGFTIIQRNVKDKVKIGVVNITKKSDCPDVHVLNETFYSSEECSSKLDRYSYCTYVTQGNDKIIKIRHFDYPWSKKKKPQTI